MRITAVFKSLYQNTEPTESYGCIVKITDKKTGKPYICTRTRELNDKELAERFIIPSDFTQEPITKPGKYIFRYVDKITGDSVNSAEKVLWHETKEGRKLQIGFRNEWEDLPEAETDQYIIMWRNG